jgi:ATP-dependent helicase/DNAse subunit B
LQGRREAFRSIESHLGTTVHDVLEWLYQERMERTSPTVERAHEEYAWRWDQSWTSDVAIIRIADSADQYFRRGREMVFRFFGEVFSRDRSETVALEHRFSMRLSPEVVFSGFADRVGRTEKGRLFVVDYKTSRRQGDSSEFSEGLQAPLYAACALENHQDEEALAGYHYLRHGATRWQSVNRARSQRLMLRFRHLAEAALAATDFPARPGILCAWCGYNCFCSSAEVPEDLSGGLRHGERG